MAAVDEYLTCAVCLGWLNSPRRLPCSHTYCLECLRGILNPESDYLACPECRRVHVIPNNRIEEFQEDGRLVQLIEKHMELKSESDVDCTHDTELSNCDHCQLPVCGECQAKHKALLLESLLQEFRKFSTCFLKDEAVLRRQKLKSELLVHQENLDTLRESIDRGIDDMIKELERRRETLFLKIETEKLLILDNLSRLEEGESICAQHPTGYADLLDKVPPTKTLISLKDQISQQHQLMSTIQKGRQNNGILMIKFDEEKLRDVIANYGDFYMALNYKNDFKVITTLDGRESGCAFKQPWGITICPVTNNVYITDLLSIIVYGSMGNYIHHITANQKHSGLAIDSNQRVIVSCGKKHEVHIYTQDLELFKSFGSQGDQNGDFNTPLGVTCDSNNNIYVVDRYNKRVQVFTPDGTYMSEIGCGVLLDPFCVRINQRQEVLVTDFQLGQVLIFTKNGTHLSSITGEGQNKLKGPVGLCLDDNGHVLVADRSNKMIQVYNDDGTHYSTITNPASAVNNMYGLAVTPTVIYVVDRKGNKIHLIANT